MFGKKRYKLNNNSTENNSKSTCIMMIASYNTFE